MTQAIKHAIEDLPNLRLPELQAYYAEVVGEPTRCPNKKFLVRRITETLAEQVAKVEPSQSPPAPETDTVAAKQATESDQNTQASEQPDDDHRSVKDTSKSIDKSLTKMSISDLQQCYVDVVGRPTSSSHRRYLIWKIRQAQKGKVPVGPRSRRNPDEPAPEFKVLPLRMEASLVASLDEARSRLGHKSRMELFRHALAVYLEQRDEHDIATMLVKS